MRYLVFDVTESKELPKHSFYHSKRLIFIENSQQDLDDLLEKLLKFTGKSFSVIDLKELIKVTYHVKNRLEYLEEHESISVLNKYMVYYVGTKYDENKMDFSEADYKVNSDEEFENKLKLLINDKDLKGFHVWNTKTNEISIYKKVENSTSIHSKELVYEGNLYQYRYLVEGYYKEYRKSKIRKNKQVQTFREYLEKYNN